MGDSKQAKKGKKVRTMCRVTAKSGSMIVATTLKTQREIKIKYNSGNVLKYCTVGDIIVGKCYKCGEIVNGKYTSREFRKNPLISIPKDKDNVLVFVRKSLHSKISEKSLEDFYDFMERTCDDNQTVSDLISSYAYLHRRSKSGTTIGTLSQTQTSMLLSWWYDNVCIRRIKMLTVGDKEISNMERDINEIYNHLLENPAKVMEVSIETCKEICNITGVCLTKEQVQMGQIVRWVLFMSNYGHCGIPWKIISSKFPKIESYIGDLEAEYSMYFDGKCDKRRAYLRDQYNDEIMVSSRINKMNDKGHPPGNIQMNPILSRDQRDAILNSLSRNISIINGNAGSGKSTVIGEIVKILEERGERVYTTSFTGKAVSRLKELGVNSMTMNMLIVSPREFGWLIVDESSMITTSLMAEFFRAYKQEFKMILVGDCNQLEPIGWGRLFEECIKSNKIHISTLTINHRSNDGIAKATSDILTKSKIRLKSSDNFNVIRGSLDDVGTILENMKEKGVKYDDVVIITPYNSCIHDLTIQAKLVFSMEGSQWSVGEKVMMKKNLYFCGRMNGDEGKIISTSSDKIRVRFADGEMEFSRKSMRGIPYIKNLVPSSCITIHRSQGSEWRHVIVYIPKRDSNKYFITKRMMYTALTRAKESVTIVGSKSSMNNALNSKPDKKFEALHKRFS